jgi:hypothetical protein
LRGIVLKRGSGSLQPEIEQIECGADAQRAAEKTGPGVRRGNAGNGPQLKPTALFRWDKGAESEAWACRF